MKSIRYTLAAASLTSFLAMAVSAQPTRNHGFAFEQLGSLLPDGNTYRSMDGSPGPAYWQQRCDYQIECSLDPEQLELHGKEVVRYHNQSPQTLRYLWLQLDENQHAADNDLHHSHPNSLRQTMDERAMQMLQVWTTLDGYGHRIKRVTDAKGAPLDHFIDQTVMRITLPTPLEPGKSFTFQIEWQYKLVDRINNLTFGRGGYEYFPEDGNYLFTITQWYPRLCVYSDAKGWQTDQFTGTGEFALNFGDFDVRISLPADYTVGATGVCQNYHKVLEAEQLRRWKSAATATEPLEIITLAEATALEKTPASRAQKTWHFKAANVRDFAWTASRKFIWDAMPYDNGADGRVMCMSYYPREAYPIYRRFSTRAIAHTLKTYGKYALPYPYPVAISVEAQNGMEYPMISFNPGRAEKDGTYTEAAKNAALTVIFHEVGHNYFPMIINSDERQWAWFDEGINTFLQFITEQEWDNRYDSGEGPPHLIVDYMSLPPSILEPIMTHSDNIIDYYSNAYRKPATALNILRETIMGREKFDLAFREYCRRWAFRHPTPADFFRTMEDAGGMDLDWFWRGWFFGIDPVDISMDSIVWKQVDMEKDPTPVTRKIPQQVEAPFQTLTQSRYRAEGHPFPVEQDTALQDFYTFYEPWTTADSLRTDTLYKFDSLYTRAEKEALFGGKHYYEIAFSNRGGLVMPVILEWTFEDGTTETERLPVEIWRKNERQFTQTFVKERPVRAVRLDPWKETADIDESNNSKPVPTVPVLFQVYKSDRYEAGPNMMQRARQREADKP